MQRDTLIAAAFAFLVAVPFAAAADRRPAAGAPASPSARPPSARPPSTSQPSNTPPSTASPATSPASPLDAAATRAAAAVRTAEGRVADAQTARAAAVERDPAVARATADVAARSKELDAARSAGDPSARLAASSAFNNARDALAKARRAAPASQEEVRRAEAALADAKAAQARAAAQLAQAREDADRAAESDRMKDPIYRAVKQKRVVVGMTLDQANAVMGKGKAVAADKAAQVYRWDVYATTDVVTGKDKPAGVQVVEGTFRDGKLAEYSLPRSKEGGGAEVFGGGSDPGLGGR